MSDDHFPDLVREAGETDAAKLEALWSVVKSMAKTATSEQVVRLVDLAHGAEIDRDRDEWFWRPFREVDGSFPASAAVPLHSRLADSCVRTRIDNGSHLDPVVVRLAELSGREPVTELLQPLAKDALGDLCEPAPRPVTPKLRAVWTDADQTKFAAALDEESTVIDPDELGKLAQGIAGNADQALAAVLRHADAVLSWSDKAYDTLRREQAITQWLVAGVRADGTPWGNLSPGVIAVDAAAELANLLDVIPPEPRHENLLLLVLRAADVPLDKPVGAVADANMRVSGASMPEALRVFTPIRVAVAQGSALEAPAREVALRVLWETVSTTLWDSA